MTAIAPGTPCYLIRLSEFPGLSGRVVTVAGPAPTPDGEQDQLAGLLQNEISVLESIRTLLQAPTIDSLQLIAQTALLQEVQHALTDPAYTIPQALQDQIMATGMMTGTTAASIDRVVQAVGILTSVISPSSASTVAAASTTVGGNGTVLGVGGDWVLPGPGLISAHASGGIASGWSMVGERGPELAYFDQPARIYTADQTRGMFSGAANEDVRDELRALREEVAGLREDNKALTLHLAAVIQGGDKANVAATDRIAENRAAIARKEELERRAHRKIG